MNKGLGGIISGVAAGAVFLLFFLFLNLGLVPSVIAGAVSLGAFLLVFRSSKAPSNPGSGSASQVEEAIRACEDCARQVNALAKEISRGPIRDKFLRLGDLSQRIAEDVRKDPKDAKDALKFINYYGDTVCKIGKLYRDLESHGLESSAIRETRLKVDGHLDTLTKAFEVQLARLQEDNLLDLDTELKVLEKTIEMEGLGDLIREEEAKSGPSSKPAPGSRVERPWDK